MTSGGPILSRMQARIKELEENNQYLLEMEASYIAENEVLREQIDSWIADRDRWLARYEAAKKENAALQERIRGLDDKFSRCEAAWIEQIQGRDARIGKLTEALIEERAQVLAGFGQDDMKMPVDDDWRKMAREQLREEGLL